MVPGHQLMLALTSQRKPWVPVNIDLGPPEACTLDSAVLSERSKKTHVREVWHSTDFTSFLVETAVAYDFLPETTIGILASTNGLASRKETHFSVRTY